MVSYAATRVFCLLAMEISACSSYGFRPAGRSFSRWPFCLPGFWTLIYTIQGKIIDAVLKRGRHRPHSDEGGSGNEDWSRDLEINTSHFPYRTYMKSWVRRRSSQLALIPVNPHLSNDKSPGSQLANLVRWHVGQCVSAKARSVNAGVVAILCMWMKNPPIPSSIYRTRLLLKWRSVQLKTQKWAGTDWNLVIYSISPMMSKYILGNNSLISIAMLSNPYLASSMLALGLALLLICSLCHLPCCISQSHLYTSSRRRAKSLSAWC